MAKVGLAKVGLSPSYLSTCSPRGQNHPSAFPQQEDTTLEAETLRRPQHSVALKKNSQTRTRLQPRQARVHPPERPFGLQHATQLAIALLPRVFHRRPKPNILGYRATVASFSVMADSLCHPERSWHTGSFSNLRQERLICVQQTREMLDPANVLLLQRTIGCFLSSEQLSCVHLRQALFAYSRNTSPSTCRSLKKAFSSSSDSSIMFVAAVSANNIDSTKQFAVGASRQQNLSEFVT